MPKLMRLLITTKTCKLDFINTLKKKMEPTITVLEGKKLIPIWMLNLTQEEIDNAPHVYLKETKEDECK